MNIKDFLDFVDFIKNADKYEQRVQSLKDENDRLETNIKLTSEIADIPRTKALTEEMFLTAKQEVATAKETASDIKEKAKTVYDKRLADLVAREKDVENKAKEASSMLVEATSITQELNAGLRSQLSLAETKVKALEITQAEVDSRLAKLKSVME